MKTSLTLASLLLVAPLCHGAPLTDFTAWSQIEDPPHANLSATIDNPTTATLRAAGAVPSGTDIGYASVNGQDAATSTSGFAFDPSQAFSIAVDFDVSTVGSVGGGAIGFGIGEDIDGVDSAGAALLLVNGSPTAFLGVGRVDDVDVTPAAFPVVAFARGRLFVDYDPNGPITVGVNATPGAANPSATQTLNGLPGQWDNEQLIVSFFLRSQSASPIPSLSSGEVTAVFSNFEVLSGAPIGVPEPATLVTLATVLLGGLSRRR